MGLWSVKGSPVLEYCCKNWRCPSPAWVHGRAGIAPHLGSILELMAGVQKSWASCWGESRRAVPTLVWHGVSRVREIWSLLPPETGGRTNLGGMRMEELALLLTKCSNLERGPCISPGQNSKVCPDGVSVDELEPRVWKQENLPNSFCVLLWVSLPGWW